MTKKIIVNNKEYKLPKMSIETYEEYAEIHEHVDNHARYTKEDIELIALFVCKAYGNEFTVEELKDPETGLDIAGLISEFSIFELVLVNDLTAKVDNYNANFQKNK